MPRTNEALAANHALFMGTTGSGKTHQMKNHPAMRTHKRILIWDPDETWRLPKMKRATNADHVKAELSKYSFNTPFKIALTPKFAGKDEFEKFCFLAFAMSHADCPLLIVVEELADVAQMGKASPFWGQLSRKARKYGTTILAASQKPQEIDKTFIDMCAVYGVGVLRNERTKKAAAGLLDVPVSDVNSLQLKDWYFRRDAEDAIRVDFKQKIPSNFDFMR